MHITWIHARTLAPIGYLTLECDERVNLFIGPNASGKSRILRAVKTLHSLGNGHSANPIRIADKDGTAHQEFLDHGTLAEDTLFCMTSSEDWIQRSSDSHSVRWDAVPFLFIPATRINLLTPHVFDASETIGEPGDVETDDPLNCLLGTNTGFFDGRYVEQVIEWLYDYETSNLERSQQFQVKRALSVGYSCAKSICSEVIYDDAPHHSIENDDSSEIGMTVHYEMGIGTNDNPFGGPLYAGALSSGTQGTLLWVWALALKIASHYDWTPGWEAKSAVLLIDEIENHLHPTWQRRVIPALLEHFPGLQIFAATHSPFVVAGRKAGQVHLLQRGEDGRVTATTNTEDVIGWTVDEILRTMMGVDDPTDQETASAAQELRKLRAQESFSDPHEEEQRQQRIQELRQRVDRDLLAGGPMAAQRELFEQHFAEALEKRRRSQDLSQENG